MKSVYVYHGPIILLQVFAFTHLFCFQLEGFSAKVIKAEDEARIAKEKLEAIKSSQVSTERLYRDESAQLKKQIGDLRSQNDHLHTELETVSMDEGNRLQIKVSISSPGFS